MLPASGHPSNGDGKYHFVTTDIRDEAAIKHLFKEAQPDAVINCSALSVPDYCETHHEEAYLTNVTAVEQLAYLCEIYKADSSTYLQILFLTER